MGRSSGVEIAGLSSDSCLEFRGQRSLDGHSPAGKVKSWTRLSTQLTKVIPGFVKVLLSLSLTVTV